MFDVLRVLLLMGMATPNKIVMRGELRERYIYSNHLNFD